MYNENLLNYPDDAFFCVFTVIHTKVNLLLSICCKNEVNVFLNEIGLEICLKKKILDYKHLKTVVLIGQWNKLPVSFHTGASIHVR